MSISIIIKYKHANRKDRWVTDVSFFFLLNSLLSKFFVMFGSIDIEDLPYISFGFEDLKMKTHPPPHPLLLRSSQP